MNECNGIFHLRFKILKLDSLGIKKYCRFNIVIIYSIYLFI
jgi:hypothetical protein